MTGLEVSLRRAPKNYPSEGNFLEASHVNVELAVVQISWQENPTRTPETVTSNLPFQANPEVCHLHTLNHSHNANDAQSTAPPVESPKQKKRYAGTQMTFYPTFSGYSRNMTVREICYDLLQDCMLAKKLAQIKTVHHLHYENG